MKATKTKLVFFLLLAPILFFATKSSGENMTSTNYQIFADVLSSGGELSTSTNFIVTDTLGEFGATSSTGASFESRGGFWNVVPYGLLGATASKDTITLGALSTAAVSSDSQTLTVTSTVASGYTMQITEDGNFRTAVGNDIDDVADGTVTAGSEEYGIRTSGTDGQFNATDTAITGSLKTIATRASFANSIDTVITYKAAVTADSGEGSYSHSVTIYVTANL